MLPLSARLLFGCSGGGSSEAKSTPEPHNTAPNIIAMGSDGIIDRAEFIFTAQANDSDGTIAFISLNSVMIDDLHGRRS